MFYEPPHDITHRQAGSWQVVLSLAESTASDFDPFPAIRVQGGRRDLGKGRVQLRQLQAPQRPGTGLFMRLSFLQGASQPHGSDLGRS